jgi:hypothetical protein
MTILTFTPEQMLQESDKVAARVYAEERQAIDQAAFGRKGYKKYSDEDQIEHEASKILPEIAWLRMNGREYDLVQSLERINQPDDIVPTIAGPVDADVKSTTWKTGWLAYRAKPPEMHPHVWDIYILIIDLYPLYKYVGWAWGYELLAEKNWDRHPRIRPDKAFAMPQKDLHKNHPFSIAWIPPRSSWPELKPEGYDD